MRATKGARLAGRFWPCPRPRPHSGQELYAPRPFEPVARATRNTFPRHGFRAAAFANSRKKQMFNGTPVSRHRSHSGALHWKVESVDKCELVCLPKPREPTGGDLPADDQEFWADLRTDLLLDEYASFPNQIPLPMDPAPLRADAGCLHARQRETGKAH